MRIRNFYMGKKNPTSAHSKAVNTAPYWLGSMRNETQLRAGIPCWKQVTEWKLPNALFYWASTTLPGRRWEDPFLETTQLKMKSVKICHWSALRNGHITLADSHRGAFLGLSVSFLLSCSPIQVFSERSPGISGKPPTFKTRGQAKKKGNLKANRLWKEKKTHTWTTDTFRKVTPYKEEPSNNNPCKLRIWQLKKRISTNGLKIHPRKFKN